MQLKAHNVNKSLYSSLSSKKLKFYIFYLTPLKVLFNLKIQYSKMLDFSVYESHLDY